MSRIPYTTSASTGGDVTLTMDRTYGSAYLIELARALGGRSAAAALDVLVDAVRHLDNPQRHTTADVVEFYEHQRDEAAGILIGDLRVQRALGHTLAAGDALTLAVEILQAGEIQPDRSAALAVVPDADQEFATRLGPDPAADLIDLDGGAS